MLELLYFLLLVGNYGFDKVAYGNHATDFAIVDNRQMANSHSGHGIHAIFYRVIADRGRYLGRHDVAHLRVARRAAF
jgi:hypothetical protein